MQVFAIDKDPIVCATALDDTRVNKMSIEAAQILSTAAILNGNYHPKLCKMTLDLTYSPGLKAGDSWLQRLMSETDDVYSEHS